MATYEIVESSNSTRPYRFKVGSYLSPCFVHRKSAEEAGEVYCKWMFGTSKLGQPPTQEFDPTTQVPTVKVTRKSKKEKAA